MGKKTTPLRSTLKGGYFLFQTRTVPLCKKDASSPQKGQHHFSRTIQWSVFIIKKSDSLLISFHCVISLLNMASIMVQLGNVL